MKIHADPAIANPKPTRSCQLQKMVPAGATLSTATLKSAWSPLLRRSLTLDPGQPSWGLERLGMKHLGHIYHNLTVPELVEHALIRGEGVLASNGALCVKTGVYTGRSPRDKFIVDEPSSRDHVHWDDQNVPISEGSFHRMYHRLLAYVQGRDLYIFDGYVGADTTYRQGVRVITELASHSLFAHQLFLRPVGDELDTHNADFTVICVPGLKGDPLIDDGINSEAFIVLNFAQKLVIIGGSRYAGEIKKSVFSMMNYFMTQADVLPMHCSANMDSDGNTALFFGLSGTGKTTLSADPDRFLIGDDEHGWSAHGVFNFEGGCYAKTIRLSHHNEPEIWDAIRFGALLENVPLDVCDRTPDYDDATLTENTRVAYPVDYIPRAVIPGLGSHPEAIIFLTADAFGVLPPIAKLTPEQAMYHFLSGYTSKLAGTERGITAPQATFSACFGQPFLPLSATVYGHMLGERLRQHPVSVYLVNTGWSGGPYGVGQRLSIQHTRQLVAAALSGALETANYHPDPIFGFGIPDHVSGVPDAILDPRQTWPDPQEYDRQAHSLAMQFRQNFQHFPDAPPEVAQVGPMVT